MFFILLLLLLLILLINIEPFTVLQTDKPPLKLFVYCEKYNNLLHLCKRSVLRHCALSFDIVYLDNNNITQYLPNERHNNLNDLTEEQRREYYKKLLLKEYGGLFLNPNVLVMKNPIEFLNKQITKKDYDEINLIDTKETKPVTFVVVNNYNYNFTVNDLIFSPNTIGKYLRQTVWLVSNDNY